MPLRSCLFASFLILLIGFVLAPVDACLAEQEPGFSTSTAEIVKADGARVSLMVDVALSPEQQAHGLMFVKDMDGNRGMIFPFSPRRRVSFWMKNTLIPLDMLFIGSKGIIIQIAANATPGDLAVISSRDEVEAVLEVNGGFAEKHGVRVGDKVESPVLSLR